MMFSGTQCPSASNVWTQFGFARWAVSASCQTSGQGYWLFVIWTLVGGGGKECATLGAPCTPVDTLRRALVSERRAIGT